MKNSDIGIVIKDGKTYKSEFFSVKTISGSTSGELGEKQKPAFITGKKLFKTAVVRNKARRLAKAALTSFKKHLQNKKVVFVLYPDILKTQTTELKNEFEKVLTKAGIIHN